MQTIFKEWFFDNFDRSSWNTGTFSDLIDSTLGGDWGEDEEAGNNGKVPTRFILPKNF